jgi:hypothetical protein
MAKVSSVLNQRLRSSFTQVETLTRQKVATKQLNEAQADRIKATFSIFLETLIDSIEEIENTPDFLESVFDIDGEDDEDDLESLLAVTFDDAA